jgi:transposase InsO family protein
MRENRLLSPMRVPQGEPNLHDGRITTDEPNQMWGTDAARVMTVEDGNCWIFAVVEHWNAECLGYRVCKHGDRLAALDPVHQAVKGEFGSLGPDVARGLSMRMDHGCQYTSDHFRRELRFLGIAASYGIEREPETNGVSERFYRTLKEQVIHGRDYRTVGELDAAVGRFVETYNNEWLVEKLGFVSPLQAKAARREAALTKAA